ncbi:MAG: phosphotransferase [Deltaproteobacteria bacterium]|nr:phosphotransferase [Deltaproteobacteria bacterium]
MNHPNLVESMMRPEFYPHKPDTVELLQTHISFIFIAGDLVYKIKKAVDFGFLDFTTLEKRKYYCEQEVVLNRRFAPDVYIGVIEITEDERKNLRPGGEGGIVEYAVKMKKIPEEKMLYRLMEADKIAEADVKRVGRHLARVYGNISSDEKARTFGMFDVISTNVIENFDQTRKYTGGPVSSEAFDAIESWSRSFMDTNSALFDMRIGQGHVKDCHGDLHLQHICIEDDVISVFDCIEFNERFRFGDVASDVAFLSMDFDFNGRSELGNIFVHVYIDESGDATLRDVLRFYKVYRAMVRAKVTSFMLDDGGLDDISRREAFQRAKRYYDLAYEYVTHED